MTEPSYFLQTLADRFDADWQSGKRPSLGEYLNSASDANGLKLLELLLPIEIEYRQNMGEPVLVDDYSELGPDAYQLVQEILARLQSQAEASAGSQDPDLTLDPSSSKLRNEAKPIGGESSEEKSRAIGPYKLLQKIGEGGMGTVWMAELEKPVRRRVALKLIKGAMADKQVIARFEAERQAVAMMDHPNIAKILDAGTTDTGNPFFVMELVNGVPINQYCDQNKLTPDERLRLFVPVCKAVQHAHQKGIIHRDLKPSNVLVQMSDGEAVAKVIDFGLAKALDQTHKLTDKTMFTQFGQVVGTLQYMSPEQATMDAMSVDTRSDIYSLGVVQYELLTGSTPVEKETLQKNALLHVLEMIREQEPPKPSHRLSSSEETLSAVSARRQIHPAKLQQILRGELDWIVMKSLEKDRTRRYETASDFAQDINNYLNGDSVNACPPSTRYQLQKFARKNRGLVASLLTVGVVLLAGIAGTTYGLIQANAKTAIAKRAEKQASAEKNRAVTAETLAAAEAKRAVRSERQSQLTLASQYAVKGIGEINRADFSAALPWFAAALQTQGLARGMAPWMRLAIAKSQSPQVVGVWPHSGRVDDFAVSTDGRTLISGSGDGTIGKWDRYSGELLSRHAGSLKIFKIVVSNDGQHFIAVSERGLHLWRLRDMKQITTIEQRGFFETVAFGDKNTLWASTAGEASGDAFVWDAKSGKQLYKKSGSTATISISGNVLLTADKEVVSVWNGRSGKLKSSLTCSNVVRELKVSHDGRWVAAAVVDGQIQVWNVATEELVATLKHDQCGKIYFDQAGDRLASVSGDIWFGESQAKVWNVNTGKALTGFLKQPVLITSLCFHPEKDQLITTGADSTARVWEISQGQTPARHLHHFGHVMQAKFFSDTNDNLNLFVSGGLFDCGHVQAWKFSDSPVSYSCSKGSPPLKVDPTGRFLLSPNGSQIDIFDFEKRKSISQLVLSDIPVVARWFGDSGRIATVAKSGKVSVWNAIAGESLYGFMYSSKGRIVDVQGSDKEDQLLLRIDLGGDNGCRFELVDSASGKTIAQWKPDFSPYGTLWSGGKILAYGHRTLKYGDSPRALLWPCAGGPTEKIKFPKGTRAVRDAAFSTDGYLAVGTSHYSGEGGGQVWAIDQETTSHSARPPVRLGGYARAIAISRDGLVSAAASNDRQVYIWQSKTGKLLTQPILHPSSVDRVKFSQDASVLMTCCQQEVFLWEIETELLIGRFTNSTPIESATLSFDMRRVALIGEDGDCTVWPLPDRMACEIDIEATNSAELTSGRTVNLKGHLSATPVKRMRKLWLEKIQSASSIQKESKE